MSEFSILKNIKHKNICCYLMFVDSFSKFLKWLLFERFPNFYRPSNGQYISYDSYRNISNHIFDEAKTFNPKKVKYNDIVFVNGRFLDNFLNTNHTKIDKLYKLLICGSNFEISESNFEKLESEKIIHIFSNNLITNNNSFTYLPLGIKDKRFLKSGNFKKYQKYKKFKNSNILSVDGPYIPSKNDLFDLDIKKVNSSHINYMEPRNHDDFYKMVSNHKFILFNNSFQSDASVFWESIMLDCFPILEINKLTKMFIELNVPALYVDSIEDVEQFDKAFLSNSYEILKSKQAENQYLYIDYWKSLINKL